MSNSAAMTPREIAIMESAKAWARSCGREARLQGFAREVPPASAGHAAAWLAGWDEQDAMMRPKERK